MIAYPSKFIPELLEQTQLRELVLKDSIWDFTVTHKNQFDKLRTFPWNFSTQNYQQKITIDPTKFTTDTTLEKKYENNWHPIDFKSRSCTSAEQNYCHLEREPLAIAFACLKFNEYLYDQKFIVESEKYSKCPDTSDTTQNPMIYHVSKKTTLW